VRVLQAIYGEVQRGHGLLAASPAEPSESPAFNRVRLRTGLIDNPPAGISWRPYLRAFVDGEFYVLTRVFADLSAPRQDMVFTHALFLPLDTFCRAGSLRSAMALLATAVNKSMALPVLELPEATQNACLAGNAVDAINNRDDRYVALVDALVSPESPQPPVWVGQEGFDRVVATLWENLSPNMRRSFEFSLVFAKSNIMGRNFTLVVTPEECASYWPGGYRLIRPHDRVGSVSPPTGYLLGRSEGAPLRRLEADLETPAADFAALHHLSRIAAYLKEADDGLAGATLDAVRQIGSYVPDSSRASVFKAQLLSRLVDETSAGGRSAVWGLRNLPLAPFAGGEAFLEIAVQAWVRSAIASPSHGVDPDLLKAITDALLLDAPRENPKWKQFFATALKSAFAAWRTQYAVALWALWTTNPSTVGLFDELLPSSGAVELALIKAMPCAPGAAVGERVLALSRSRSWYLLHAVTAVSFLAPEDAIVTHYEFDRRETDDSALDLLTRTLADSVVVKSSVTLQDQRLYRIASARVVRRPELLRGMDVRDCGWRSLLLHSLEAGVTLPESEGRGAGIVSDVLDLLISGVPIEPELLSFLSRAPGHSDLCGYAARDAALSRMPPDVRAAFVRMTTEAWMGRFESEPGSAPPITGLVRDSITSGKCVQAWLRTPRATPERVTAFFRLFGEAIDTADELLAQWIHSQGVVSTVQAASIGSLIGDRLWRAAARELASAVATNIKWGAGLPPCRPLLGALMRFQLALSGVDDTIAADDWWETWAAVSSRLFAGGIQDSRIWTIADGDTSQINLNEPGRTQWLDALALLRRGKARWEITVPGLLHRMRNEFPRDTELLALERMWLSGKVNKTGAR
jgi:hypothetical protein